MCRLIEAWRHTVGAAPHSRALIDASTGAEWTRSELDARAEAWHAQTRSLGLARRRVALAARNGIDWWTVFLGLQAADAIPVLLDPTEPLATQAAIARELRVSWIWREGVLEPTGQYPRERSPSDCLLKVTSGSTGRPQGRAFTHAHMLADGRQVCASMQIAAADLNLAVIPFGHSYGLGNLVLPLIAQGTPLLIASGPLPNVLAAECERWRPTVFPSVPAVLRALIRSAIAPRQLESLRLVISAGAPLLPEVAVAFNQRFGRRIHNFYGATETGGICYDRDGEATLTGRSVGTPLDGVELRFTRGQRFRVQSAAVSGRGAFLVGDRGRLNERGELELLGRAGRTTKVGGRRVDLGEIEAAVRSLAGIREVYAAEGRREETIAVAVCTERSVAELKNELRSKLAPWKIPDQWLLLPEFPLTARGKTDTRELRARLRD